MILGKDHVDRRADVYAIGCVAFYLLTGTRVFEEGTQMQALIDHVHTEPVPPSARLGQPLTKELDQFVLDCLRKKPEDRPRTRRSCSSGSGRHVSRAPGRTRMRAPGGRHACRSSPGRSTRITGIKRRGAGIYQCVGSPPANPATPVSKGVDHSLMLRSSFARLVTTPAGDCLGLRCGSGVCAAGVKRRRTARRAGGAGESRQRDPGALRRRHPAADRRPAGR